MKFCTACGEQKPLSEFYSWTNRDGKKARQSKCQPCRRAQFKVYAKTARGKQVKRNGILRREYKITEAQYQLMHNRQGGVCAICRMPETKTLRGKLLCLSVDHCHAKGDVRALLCQACNVGLGSFRDSPDLLLAAASYLGGKHEEKAG